MKSKNNKILIAIVSIVVVLVLIVFLLVNCKFKESVNSKIYEENLSKNKYKSNLVVEDNNSATMLDDELEDEGEERIFPVEDDQEIILLPNPNINESVILKKLWNKKLESSTLKIMVINKIELFLFIY